MTMDHQAEARWLADPTPYPVILRLSDGKRFVALGVSLLATALLPVSGDVGGPAWIWDLWGVVGWLDRLALLSPVLLGALLLALGVWSSLSRFWTGVVGLLGLLASAALFSNSDLQLHQAFDGFTGFIGRNPALVLLGLSVTATGAELVASPETSRLGRVGLIAGGLGLVLFTLLPLSGTPLLNQLIGHAWALVRLERWRLFAGNLVFWGLALVPLGVGVGALWGGLRQPTRHQVLPHIARFLLPGLVLLMTYPALMVGLGPEAALMQIRASLLILVVVNVGARSLEMVARDLLEYSLPPGPPFSDWLRDQHLRQILNWGKERLDQCKLEGVRLDQAPQLGTLPRPLSYVVRRRLVELGSECGFDSRQAVDAKILERARTHLGTSPSETSGHSSIVAWLWRRPLRAYSAAGLACALGLASTVGPLLPSPPRVAWELKERSEVADRLFQSVLPEYVAALARRDQALVDRSGAAEASVDIRQQAVEAERLAHLLDEELGQRVAHIVRISSDSHASAVGWIRSVDRLNQRVRELGLPYHVYANAVEFLRDQKKYRFLYINTYAVQELRWFLSDGRTLASLLARRLDSLSFEGDGLGRVVRNDPFANLLMDVVEKTAYDFSDVLLSGVCEPAGYSSTVTPLDQMAWAVTGEQCGELLGRLAGGNARETGAIDSVVESILELTQRHELQHQADPQELAIPVDVLVAHPSRSDVFLRLVARELSAYCCELATSDPLQSAFALLGLYRVVMTEPFAGTPEYIVSALILGELVGSDILDERGVALALTVGSSARQLLAEDTPNLPALLSQRAQAAHLEWFGRPCASPELVKRLSTTSEGALPFVEFQF